MLDRVFQILKWPVAFASVALFPGLVLASLDLLGQIARQPAALKFFGLGALSYVLVWHFLFRGRITGSFFPTFEHELSHAIFAWLSLHRVRGFKATWSRGGHIRFEGRGNWLITIAPYYFPTLAIPAAVLHHFFSKELGFWSSGLLGASVAYHLISNWKETHRGQTNLREVGFAFCFLFLPTANLLVFSGLLAFAFAGLPAIDAFVWEAVQISESLWYSWTS